MMRAQGAAKEIAHAILCIAESQNQLTDAGVGELLDQALASGTTAVRGAGLDLVHALLLSGEAPLDQVREAHGDELELVLRSDPFVMNQVSSALVLVQVDAARPGLEAQIMRLFRHGDAGVSDHAFAGLRALGRAGQPQVIKRLMARMGTATSEEKLSLLASLGQAVAQTDSHHGQAAIQQIIKQLTDSDPNVRMYAAHAVAAIGPAARGAEPELQSILWDPKQPAHLRDAAKDAITAVGAAPRPPWLKEAETAAPGETGASRGPEQ